MISGSTLAFAHLAICVALLGAALVSAHRARHGVRVGRRGDRYRRLTSEQVLKRIGDAGMGTGRRPRGKSIPGGQSIPGGKSIPGGQSIPGGRSIPSGR